ncbi:cbb3-type cytochrome c oxidase N-terminal domain-containing protein [Cognataquiflexum rubidum]|uniref:cbb3-type cytochrome c oxidase N-terminal domain-containing protein n=1 Tax=Cognataquiflexum rubidum TaxID=2922273 RepID=UPI001F135729|nr:cbb3-type cytochrome c oxidase N-terminal domain-containing protein [Cognataquiflexum rubidum]MCH6234951.1 c-type cytochrome [Cognataquiflexum rubidum]
MKKFKSFFLLLTGMFAALPAFAQTSESTWFANLQSMDPTQLTLLVILGVVLGIIVLLLVLMIYLITFMSAVFKKENSEMASQPTWWDEFKIKYVTGTMKPVGGKEEKQKMLDHSYDGIVELDNHMPPWLANVFFLTIGIAVVYFMYYTVLGIGPTQLEEYEEEHRIAAIQIEEYKALAVSNIDETTVVFDETPAAIAAGQSIYSANCVACHAADGGGGVGSNLTDEFWKHGGSINDIFKVIKYGVVEKGMIPWQDQLSPEQMQQVSSFVKTLQGTTPANPKEAEGERYVPGGAAEPAKTDSLAVPVIVEAIAEVK